MVSDSLHTLSAIGGVLIAMVAIKISKRSANYKYSFWYYRGEVLWALLNSFVLFGTIFYVGYMAYMRLQSPIELPPLPMIIVGVAALILEIILLKMSYQSQKWNLNMKGAFVHILMTFFGSVGIIITAVVIKYTGFSAIDPIMGIVFSLILLRMAWWIARQSIHIILEWVPPQYDIQKIVWVLESLPGVINIHHIHVWEMSSQKYIAMLHSKIEKEINPDKITKKITDILQTKYNIYFSSIQCEKGECLSSDVAKNIDIV